MLGRLRAPLRCWPTAWPAPALCGGATGHSQHQPSPLHAGAAPATPDAPAAATAAATAAWRRRFDDIAPGSILRLGLLNCAADVAVRVGEHEAIELSSDSGALQAGRSDSQAREGATVVSVVGPGSADVAPEGAPLPRLALHAAAPSRFLSIEATTSGGAVQVEVVNEGSLRVSSGGGDITVPKVKAVDAHLYSGGGSIAGSVTGVDVRLDSGGGPLALRGLVGKRAALRSGGGPLTLGACYADELELDSGGGPIKVTNMDCRAGSAAVRSGGGAVAIDSLDGNLAIESASGTVQVQLADNAGIVSVLSGGGDVQLFLSPGLAGTLRLRACSRVNAPPGTVQQVETEDDGSLLFRLPLEQGARGGSAASAAGHAAPQSRLQRGGVGGAAQAAAGAEVVVDAGGSGSISMVQRGWMDAMRQRWS